MIDAESLNGNLEAMLKIFREEASSRLACNEKLEGNEERRSGFLRDLLWRNIYSFMEVQHEKND